MFRQGMRSRTMRRVLSLAAVAGLLVTTPAVVLAAAPFNDDFASAAVIAPAGLPYALTVDSRDATAQASEPMSDCDDTPVSQTVWYRFTPSSSGVYRVDTIGSNWDTSVDVFHGTTLANLTSVDCNEDIDSGNPDLYTSRIAFKATAGQRYYLRVLNTSPNPGLVHDKTTLHLVKTTAPSNDNYSNATKISALPFDANADTASATSQPSEPRYGHCAVARASRWYKYTPPTDMVIWANTFIPTDFDTVVSVFTGNKIGSAHLVICNDDNWVNYNLIYASGVTFKAKAGVTYHFQVAGFNGESGASGELPFHVRQITPEGNDNYSSAISTANLPFQDVVNLRNTTKEPSEPNGCGAEASNTAWYRYTAPSSDALRASVTGLTEATDFEVAVYHVTGAGLGGLSFVDCSAVVDFVPASGETYAFQVVQDLAKTSPITFNLDLEPAP